MAGRPFSLICDEEGKRLDVFLSEKLALTRTRAKDMVDQGRVTVDRKIPKPSLKVRRGMQVQGEVPEDRPLTLSPEEIPLNILYEDTYLLAVDKPAGMVVHPSFGHSDGTLVNAVLGYLNQSGVRSQESGVSHLALSTQHSALSTASLRPGIVHRLDKGTSGVILVAKDWRTQEMLSSLFKARSMEKTYRAVVEGTLKQDNGTIEGNIGRHKTERKRMAVLKQGGREASTSFKVLKRIGRFTYLEAYPKTGRTHQIRVHFAHLGHPVVGDDAYGKWARNLQGRPLLHAFSISFRHPVTGDPIFIEAPVPEDMEEFLGEHRGETVE